MRAARGIAQVVLAVVLVHPGGFEEAAVGVASKDWFAEFIDDDSVARLFVEFQHVTAQLRDPWRQGLLIPRSIFGCRAFGVVHTINDHLKLSAGEPAEVH